MTTKEAIQAMLNGEKVVPTKHNKMIRWYLGVGK